MKKIFVLPLIILFLVKTQFVFADNDVFTVDNIKITGEINIKDYRNKHLKSAYKKGFQKLITNIVKKENAKKLLSTDFKTIQSLISSYRILDESVLDDKYNLEVSIIFDKTLVTKYFFKQNISYSEAKNLEIIVYPILIIDDELQVLSKNKFFNEWNEEDIFENINFILPVENLEDINFIKTNLPDLEELDLSKLVDNYEIKNSTILILRYYKKKLNIFIKTNFNEAKKFSKIDFKLDDLDNRQVRLDIIKNLKLYINEIWKEENIIDISTPSFLTLNFEIENPESLEKIINKVKNISLIDTYSIKKLDMKNAKVKIKFFGKIKNLQESFDKIGFNYKIINDQWNLSLKKV